MSPAFSCADSATLGTKRSAAKFRSPTAAALERGRAHPLFMTQQNRDMLRTAATAGRTAIRVVHNAVLTRAQAAAKRAIDAGKHPLEGAAERYAAHKVKSAIPLHGPFARAGPIRSVTHGYVAPAAAGPFADSLFPTHCRCSTYHPRKISKDHTHRVYKCDGCAPKTMGLGDYVRTIEHHGFQPRKNTRKRGVAHATGVANTTPTSQKSKSGSHHSKNNTRKSKLKNATLA